MNDLKKTIQNLILHFKIICFDSDIGLLIIMIFF